MKKNSTMDELLEKNNITQDRIIPLTKITSVIENALDEKLSRLEWLEKKLDKLNDSIENVDSPFKEVKDLKKKIIVLEHDNDYLKSQNEKLEEHKINLENRLKNVIENHDLKRTKEAYRSLLVFAFNNINPVTSFDPAHAKQHWENLIK
jgi:hypothetical protein